MSSRLKGISRHRRHSLLDERVHGAGPLLPLDAMIAAGLAVEKNVLQEELDEVINEFSSNYEHHFDKLLLRIPKRFYRGLNPALIVAAGVIAYHDIKARRLARTRTPSKSSASSRRRTSSWGSSPRGST